jgi:ATP-dependent Clp protease ATP-binding subunit ClpA
LPKKVERFTVKARRTLFQADAEARQRHHTVVDTEHLLLGMMRDPSGITIRALDGLDIQQVETAMEELSPAHESTQSDEWEISSHVRKLLELAVHEARKIGHHYISPEHLLLGMLQQSDTKAIQILKQAGLKPSDVRQHIQYHLSKNPPQFSNVFGRLIKNKRFDIAMEAVLAQTQIEAENLNCKLFDTQHLLLGLLRNHNEIVQQVFAENDMTYNRVMQHWLQTPAEPRPGRSKLSPAFRQVFKQAIVEADAFEQWQIGPEHLLLSLMTVSEGEMVDLLHCLDTSPQKIREHTFQVIVRENPYNKTGVPGRFIRFINRVFGIEL